MRFFNIDVLSRNQDRWFLTAVFVTKLHDSRKIIDLVRSFYLFMNEIDVVIYVDNL